MDNKNSLDQKSVSEAYSSLSEATSEVMNRWNDKVLQRKVADFLGSDLPKLFKYEPRAVIFRFIATPNFECDRFMKMAKSSGLSPVYVEFLNDKFCTRNQDKFLLGQIITSDIDADNLENCADSGKNNTKKNIIHIQENDNKEFLGIRTDWGERLIDFHHRLFMNRYGNLDTFDISEFKKNGEDAYEVYVKFFSLFICNGILFENYIEKEDSYEREFTKNIIIPAIQRVTDEFGVKPLIVSLLPVDSEHKRCWMWYSKKLEGQIRSLFLSEKLFIKIKRWIKTLLPI